MITQERLKSLYNYVSTGHFKNIKTNKIVYGQKNNRDRICIAIRVNKKPKKFLYYRMIWIWHHGEAPKELDHKNGNHNDNRIENLRPCTRSQNNANSKNRKKYKGVVPVANGKFVARLFKGGKYIHIGTFCTEKDAAKAYDKKAKEVFKEFARTNF